MEIDGGVVCVYSTYNGINHDSACLGRQKFKDVVVINWSVNLFALAAVQVQFDPQNYTVTEGDVVNITLVTNTSDYMFNFTVTLQNMDGSATGECLNWNLPSQEHLKSFWPSS